MSYRFCFGASGAGKSFELNQEVIRRAGSVLDHFSRFGEESGQLPFYLYVVPEQYTMQTQMDLVVAGHDQGIMNIDVLSFGRLSHRVFEEVGADTRAALDDLGKSLIIGRVAQSHKDELSVLGGKLGKLGMITEVKSVISEFMQYDISPEGVGKLSEYARSQGQGALSARLMDLKKLYEGFLLFKKDRFITGEETLDLLCEAIPHSSLIRNSVLYFDGFTGFTPVQYRVLIQLMKYAREVVISLTIADDGGPGPEKVMQKGTVVDEQDLFYLSRKTIRDITRLAEEEGIPHEPDTVCAPGTPWRFRRSAVLAHLEKSLFRYPLAAYPGPFLAAGDAVRIRFASDPIQEVRQMCILLKKLSEEKGYAYRDFAIVCGDLASYADEIEKQALRYEIPVYIDTTRGAGSNVLTEGIRMALAISGGDWSYESVFGYLRSGLSLLEREEVDLLENDCLKRGVRTRKRWEMAAPEAVNDIRLRFLQEIRPLTEGRGFNARERTMALYEFLTGVHAQEKMQKLSEDFASLGDPVRQKEYDQIYGAVMNLLDQLYELMSEDKINARDYLEVVETGIGEIRLGTLPQQVDRVLVGDMERTRLRQVKVLFFLGVNDGSIPRNAAGGGLISDLDREFLEESGTSLAPTPRQQMYIQRLYLYLNMTKPTDMLIVSYCGKKADGSSVRPSYLIPLLKRTYPDLVVETPEEAPMEDQIVSRRDSLSFLAGALRRYADGLYDTQAQAREVLLTIYGVMADAGAQTAGRTAMLTDAAFFRYDPKSIRRETAEKLYGRVLFGSVTRFETAAGCFLRQFLQYGLRLRRRETYDVEAADTGTVLHNAISYFARELAGRGLDWRDLSREEGREIASRALDQAAGEYKGELLYQNARSEGQVQRMRRILDTTVDTLQYQVSRGEFTPALFEVSFGEHGEFAYALEDGRQLRLHGRIDRVDVASGEDTAYLKIIDYKSGRLDLSPAEIKKGLRLQLMVYMNAMMQAEIGKAPGKEVIPAALLYYHFDDPVLTGRDAADLLTNSPYEGQEEILKERRLDTIRRNLCPRGMVNGQEDVLRMLDRDFTDSSDVIPVKKFKNGKFSQGDKIYTTEEFRALWTEAETVMKEIAGKIMDGDIEANPMVMNANRTSCTYCPYANVCGFDRKTPGYQYRE